MISKPGAAGDKRNGSRRISKLIALECSRSPHAIVRPDETGVGLARRPFYNSRHTLTRSDKRAHAFQRNGNMKDA